MGVEQPVEKLLVDPQLDRPAVPVVDQDLSNRTDVAPLDELTNRMIARIPCGLVVGEHVNAVLLGECLYLRCVIEAHSQRLLDHHVNIARRGRLDDGEMFTDGTERGDAFGLRGIEHLVHRIVDEPHVETVLLAVAPGEFPIRLNDADDLEVFARSAFENPVNVGVREPDDAEAEGWL